jgi:Ca2+-binding RTX toxin-like protein
VVAKFEEGEGAQPMRRSYRVVGVLVIALVAASMASSAGTAPLNVIYGTGGHDKIAATPAADVIYAKSGNDTITGLGSGDVVYASSGNDRVSFEVAPVDNVLVDTNVGHDTIEAPGFVTNASINSGSGNDTVKVNGCAISYAGESGNDKYTNNAACSTPNSANVGNGNDEVVLLNATNVHLGNGNDKLTTSTPGAVGASDGNDRITFQGGGFALVTLGVGHDTVDLIGAHAVTVVGSNGDDRVSIRGGGDHVVHGQGGNDTTEISELGADNALFGGMGRDKARLAAASSGTTCDSIENVVDWSHRHTVCS